MLSVLPHLEYYLRWVPGFQLVQPTLDAWALRQWRSNRVSPPPRSVKAEVIRRHAGSERRALVETGTFFGDMLALLREDFEVLHSIELSPRLARRAERRFGSTPRIHIHEGDSAALLEAVLRSVRQPAVLWLDGHYSGPLTARGDRDTPLLEEIEIALRCGTLRDAILVDDARLLGSDPAYPTLDQLRRRITASRPAWKVKVECDVVCAAPADTDGAYPAPRL
jgi:hypothetical protein